MNPTLLNIISFLAGSFCGIVAVFGLSWLRDFISRARRRNKKIRYLTPRLITENRNRREMSALDESFWNLR